MNASAHVTGSRCILIAKKYGAAVVGLALGETRPADNQRGASGLCAHRF
ncbi:MAG: hypothetical protein ACLUHE_17140 [Christensenellales bacterium]